MELQKALQIAEGLKSQLEPYCDRIEIAGSIRRKRPEVKDIEIVCIPKIQETSAELFDIQVERSPGFIKTVNQWEKVKGEPTGKYTQRILPNSGMKVDIFMCVKENWGNIFAIRTGSADYSHKILAAGWVKAGYESIGGFICLNGKPVFLYEEEELFNLIGVPYCAPEKREV